MPIARISGSWKGSSSIPAVGACPGCSARPRHSTKCRAVDFTADDDERAPPRDATLHAGSFGFTTLDVGQGDAAVVLAPSGCVALLDGGPTGAGTTIKQYLRSLGVDHVDFAVVSHYHEDHLGGLDVAGGAQLEVDELLPGFPHRLVELDGRGEGLQLVRLAALLPDFERVLNVPYEVSWPLPIAGLLVGAVGVAIAGLLGTRRAVSSPPLQTIRAVT